MTSVTCPWIAFISAKRDTLEVRQLAFAIVTMFVRRLFNDFSHKRPMEQHVRKTRQKVNDVAEGVYSRSMSDEQIALHLHEQELFVRLFGAVA